MRLFSCATSYRLSPNVVRIILFDAIGDLCNKNNDPGLTAFQINLLKTKQ